MDIVEENADEDANIIFGTTTSEDIPLDQVKLTIIATGFEDPSDLELPTKSEEATINNTTATLRQPIRGSVLNNRNSQKVVGGYDSSNEDYLDTPTFLRKQMD